MELLSPSTTATDDRRGARDAVRANDVLGTNALAEVAVATAAAADTMAIFIIFSIDDLLLLAVVKSIPVMVSVFSFVVLIRYYRLIRSCKSSAFGVVQQPRRISQENFSFLHFESNKSYDEKEFFDFRISGTERKRTCVLRHLLDLSLCHEFRHALFAHRQTPSRPAEKTDDHILHRSSPPSSNWPRKFISHTQP